MIGGFFTGIFGVVYKILSSIFKILEDIFSSIKRRIQFLIDVVNEEVKFEKSIKKLKSKINRERKLNNEI